MCSISLHNINFDKKRKEIKIKAGDKHLIDGANEKNDEATAAAAVKKETAHENKKPPANFELTYFFFIVCAIS
jgi:hypothetical protein